MKVKIYYHDIGDYLTREEKSALQQTAMPSVILF
jgi:hypothetical protein